MKIRPIVNGKQVELEYNNLTYCDIVELAVPNPNWGIIYTITYRNALPEFHLNPYCPKDGIITPGEYIVADSGTEIVCCYTDNA